MPPPDFAASNFVSLLIELLDPDWYLARYPDIAAANLDPVQHFTRYGAAEKRNPNAYFDGAWYIEHYPDVAASGLNPLTHYLQAGAAELRNPHPRFDAAYYAGQHPDAAANPLLHHLRIGKARGYRTEPTIDIRDYLPAETQPLPPPAGVFADVIIPVRHSPEQSRHCIRSVLADRSFPLARIIVTTDRSTKPELTAWLQELAAEGQIHLIHNRRKLHPAAAAEIAIQAAESHDVVLLSTDIQVLPGWLHRLTCHAYAKPGIATVSPLSNTDDANGLTGFGETPDQIDEACQTANAGRSVSISEVSGHCLYIRRAALDVEPFAPHPGNNTGFVQRTIAAGWHHRLACDTFVYRNGISDPSPHLPARDNGHLPRPATTGPIVPNLFAVTAALLRQSQLPVILMVTHNLGGGVQTPYRQSDTALSPHGPHPAAGGHGSRRRPVRPLAAEPPGSDSTVRPA